MATPRTASGTDRHAGSVPEPFAIAGTHVLPGRRHHLEIPVARLTTGTPICLPVTVLHGSKRGVCMWVSAVIHGDEINGLEIIRRLLLKLEAKDLAGTLIAVPVVNVFGFLDQSRYLPDRRDLNRSFPGSPRGSLASRLAHLFMKEIVTPSAYGVDLHTAGNHRDNLPQIRADLDDEPTARAAEAFGAPVMIHSAERDGSLRRAATGLGKKALLYEAGEPLRFNERAIETGLAGVQRVMHVLGMMRKRPPRAPGPVIRSRKSGWTRAPRSGVFHRRVQLGDHVERGQPLGDVLDAYGGFLCTVRSAAAGVVIGVTKLPLVHQGDALVHIAHT